MNRDLATLTVRSLSRVRERVGERALSALGQSPRGKNPPPRLRRDLSRARERVGGPAATCAPQFWCHGSLMSEMTTVSIPKDLHDKLQALTPPGGKLSDAIATLVSEHENQRVID